MMLKERFRNALKTTLVMHFKRVGKLFFRKVPESECLRFAGHAVSEQLLSSAARVWKGGHRASEVSFTNAGCEPAWACGSRFAGGCVR